MCISKYQKVYLISTYNVIYVFNSVVALRIRKLPRKYVLIYYTIQKLTAHYYSIEDIVLFSTKFDLRGIGCQTRRCQGSPGWIFWNLCSRIQSGFCDWKTRYSLRKKSRWYIAAVLSFWAYSLHFVKKVLKQFFIFLVFSIIFQSSKKQRVYELVVEERLAATKGDVDELLVDEELTYDVDASEEVGFAGGVEYIFKLL